MSSSFLQPKPPTPRFEGDVQAGLTVLPSGGGLLNEDLSIDPLVNPLSEPPDNPVVAPHYVTPSLALVGVDAARVEVRLTPPIGIPHEASGVPGPPLPDHPAPKPPDDRNLEERIFHMVVLSHWHHELGSSACP